MTGENLRPLAGERRLRRSAGEPGNVRRRGKKQHAAVFDLKAQRGIDPANAPEGVQNPCAELDAALRCVGISGPEAPAQRLPGDQRRPLQIADAPGRPGIEIERQRRLLEYADRAQIERNGRGDKLLEEVLPKA